MLTFGQNTCQDKKKSWSIHCLTKFGRFFTEKNKTTNNIILTENNQTVKEGKTICQIFNNYFTNVTKGLKLRQVDEYQSIENEESC